MTDTAFNSLAVMAENAIAQHAVARRHLVDVSTTLANLERQRSDRKMAAILRMCQAENPATPSKPFSASQAADFAQLDPEYAKYKLQVQNFGLAKLEAEIELESARLTAELRIALVKLEGGLR